MICDETKLVMLVAVDVVTAAAVVVEVGVMNVECSYSQNRLISPRLIEHSRNITNFLGTGRLH